VRLFFWQQGNDKHQACNQEYNAAKEKDDILASNAGNNKQNCTNNKQYPANQLKFGIEAHGKCTPVQ
jgi:hypothetical protein